jgi:ATP-dependent DNA ligase
MNQEVFREGEIIVLAPGEPGEFQVLQDAITVVVKSPSVAADKYLV